jgi:hypothetical protein
MIVTLFPGSQAIASVEEKVPSLSPAVEKLALEPEAELVGQVGALILGTEPVQIESAPEIDPVCASQVPHTRRQEN